MQVQLADVAVFGHGLFGDRFCDHRDPVGHFIRRTRYAMVDLESNQVLDAVEKFVRLKTSSVLSLSLFLSFSLLLK